MNDVNPQVPAGKLLEARRQKQAASLLKIESSERNESYFELVWRRFRRSTISIIGGLMVLALIILAIFAEFFSPGDIYKINLSASFMPPQQVHFIDEQGKFHLVPFVYKVENTLSVTTFEVTWAET